MVVQLNHAVLHQRRHANGMKLSGYIFGLWLKYLIIGVSSIGLPSRLFIILETSHVLKDTQFPLCTLIQLLNMYTRIVPQCSTHKLLGNTYTFLCF